MHQRAKFETGGLHPLPLRECDGQERWDKAISGRWQCGLRVVTPLCIKAEFERQERQHAKGATIPGSSIRGMVRNAAEILGAGCGRFYGGGPELPSELAPCGDARACLVCRIFGFVQGNTTWQSRVRFTDATTISAKWDKLFVDGRGAPGGEAERKEGWALFPHRDEGPLPRGRVACVLKDTDFTFRVDYQNLDATELAVFRLALTLDDGDRHLVHKLGFGKSQGLGSCRVWTAQGGDIADAARREEVEHQTLRYAGMSGFRDLARWRTLER